MSYTSALFHIIWCLIEWKVSRNPSPHQIAVIITLKLNLSTLVLKLDRTQWHNAIFIGRELFVPGNFSRRSWQSLKTGFWRFECKIEMGNLCYRRRGNLVSLNHRGTSRCRIILKMGYLHMTSLYTLFKIRWDMTFHMELVNSGQNIKLYLHLHTKVIIK